MSYSLAAPKVPFVMRATTSYWSYMTMLEAALRWDKFDVEEIVDEWHGVALSRESEEGDEILNLVVAVRVCLWVKGLEDYGVPVPAKLAEMRKEVGSRQYARYTPTEVDEINEEFNEVTNTSFTLLEEEEDG